MTKVDSIPTPASGGSSRHRGRTIALIVAAVVVVAVVITALVLAGARGAATNAGGGDQQNAADLVPGASNSPAPPSPSASADDKGDDKGGSDGSKDAPKIDARYGAAVAQTVAPNTDAKLSGGLTAKVVSVESEDAKAVRAGETAGSALKVTITLTNTTGKDVSLSQVSVNSFYGSKSTPAVALTDGAKPLTGALATGATASGVYLFTIPKNQQDSAVFTMTDSAGSPVTVFK